MIKDLYFNFLDHIRAICGLVLYALAATVFAGEVPVVRVGVLNFGTVHWELQVIKSQGLDAQNNFELEVVPLGSKNATHVAIQGGAVDIIVTDWVWVNRQRHRGRDYTFVPYSTSMGSIVARPGSGIDSVSALQGRSIGVAGGPVDKSWVLLSAYVQKQYGNRLAEMVTPNFAAPPLLNELFQRGEFDAVLNFWHYAARLEAQGNPVILRIQEILPEIGIDRPLPMIGWVFSESWAGQRRPELEAFLLASFQAKDYMVSSDEIWRDIRPLLKADSEQMASTLRDEFRKGVPGCFQQQDRDAMARAYSLLATYGGKNLVGDSTELDPGTVWMNYRQPGCGATE